MPEYRMSSLTGDTEIQGPVEPVRLKSTNRLAAMAEALELLGVVVEPVEDEPVRLDNYTAQAETAEVLANRQLQKRDAHAANYGAPLDFGQTVSLPHVGNTVRRLRCENTMSREPGQPHVMTCNSERFVPTSENHWRYIRCGATYNQTGARVA